MTTEAREPLAPPEAEGRSLRFSVEPDETAVSPVIGMILVLAVSIVGISAILYWGLPAIDEMKANVEYRSAETQFEELDASIKELAAGTTEKTAKRWQPTISRGSIGTRNNTEYWLYAYELYNTSAVNKPDYAYSGLTDGDNAFQIRSNNLSLFVKVEASIVTGTSTSTPLSVNVDDSPGQMTGASLPTWTAGDTKTFYVYSGSDKVRLENSTFKLVVYTGSSRVAEAFYSPTGRVEFVLESGLGNKSVVANNGAVITGANGGYAVVNSPSIPPPADTGGVRRAFARNLVLGGNTSLGGTDTFDVLITLYATATLANYDCADDTAFTDCVHRVKIFNYGIYQAPWHSYLTNANKGYRYVEKTTTVGGASVKHLEDSATTMGFTLLQSSIRLSGG